MEKIKPTNGRGTEYGWGPHASAAGVYMRAASRPGLGHPSQGAGGPANLAAGSRQYERLQERQTLRVSLAHPAVTVVVQAVGTRCGSLPPPRRLPAEADLRLIRTQRLGANDQVRVWVTPRSVGCREWVVAGLSALVVTWYSPCAPGLQVHCKSSHQVPVPSTANCPTRLPTCQRCAQGGIPRVARRVDRRGVHQHMIFDAVKQLPVHAQPSAIANKDGVDRCAAVCMGGHPGGHDAHCAVLAVTRCGLQAVSHDGEKAVMRCCMPGRGLGISSLALASKRMHTVPARLHAQHHHTQPGPRTWAAIVSVTVWPTPRLEWSYSAADSQPCCHMCGVLKQRLSQQ